MRKIGDNDVGDDVWWQHHYVDDYTRYVGDVFFHFGHQHPNSVTNISNLSLTHFVINIRHQYRFNQNFDKENFTRRLGQSLSSIVTSAHSKRGWLTIKDKD